MDDRTGKIYPNKLAAMFEAGDFAREMKVPPTEAQLARGIPTKPLQTHIGVVGKYDPCPCGSGKKFKFCCFHGGVTNPTHEELADALGVQTNETATQVAIMVENEKLRKGRPCRDQ